MILTGKCKERRNIYGLKRDPKIRKPFIVQQIHRLSMIAGEMGLAIEVLGSPMSSSLYVRAKDSRQAGTECRFRVSDHRPRRKTSYVGQFSIHPGSRFNVDMIRSYFENNGVLKMPSKETLSV